MINHPNRSKKAKTEKAQAAPVIVSYKGFDKNFRCREHQFKVGSTYSVSGTIEACANGFHACENPLDVWGYYGPGDSRFAIVEQTGAIARHEDDSKIASAQITIKAELSLPEFIKRGVDYLLAQVNWEGAKESNTGDQSAATNTGNRSAATNTGDQSAATNTGDQSAATNTGNRSAATNTGDRSAATNTGEDGVALASGYEGRVSGAEGCALFLVERDGNYKIVWEFCGHAGAFGVAINSRGEISGPHPIKADTFYLLKGGKPVEWVDAE